MAARNSVTRPGGSGCQTATGQSRPARLAPPDTGRAATGGEIRASLVAGKPPTGHLRIRQAQKPHCDAADH